MPRRWVLPCNSDPTCATVLAGITVTDNCDQNVVPQCNVTFDSGPGCSHVRTFTITAVDDCGNPATPCVVTYTWTDDTEAPVINGCPAGGPLPCNSDPTCATVLAGIPCPTTATRTSCRSATSPLTVARAAITSAHSPLRPRTPAAIRYTVRGDLHLDGRYRGPGD